MRTILGTFFVAAALLFTSSALSLADDASDATAAFQTFLDYQKTDDSRSPDLFTDDCAVTYIFTDGVRRKEIAFTPEQFRAWLQKALALKHGNNDTYENVKAEQAGADVKVSADILYHETGLRGPISLVYIKDGTGAFKIKEMKATIPVPPNR